MVAQPFQGQQVSAPLLNPAQGFVTIPASNATALATPCRALLITTAGNLGVVMADGTSNNSQLCAVTASQVLPLSVVQFTAGNTAAALGLT